LKALILSMLNPSRVVAGGMKKEQITRDERRIYLGEEELLRNKLPSDAEFHGIKNPINKNGINAKAFDHVTQATKKVTCRVIGYFSIKGKCSKPTRGKRYFY